MLDIAENKNIEHVFIHERIRTRKLCSGAQILEKPQRHTTY